MGVWGSVISQPRPNFLDTSLVTVRLHAMMTDFIARLFEFWFAIISSLISAGLKLALLWKISSTEEKTCDL
jgi:hypothetical protein